MSYTPTYKRPYEQWKELPSKETLVTAEVLTQYDDTFEKIEEYLESEGKKEYALVTEAGYSIVASIDEYYVLTVVMKNKAGDVLSTSEPIDLPIESMIINVDYDEESGILTFSLQNGQTLSVNISTIVRGLVPISRTIAGVDLEDDITAEELKDALGMYDEGLTAGTLKPWLYDTEKEVEIGVYNGKPLYRQVYVYEEVSIVGGMAYVTIDVENPEEIYIENAYAVAPDGGIWPIPYAHSNAVNNIGVFISSDYKGLNFRLGTAHEGTVIKACVILNYTKTTDLEGSGNNLNPYGIYDAKLDDVKSTIASVSDEVDAVEEKVGKLKYEWTANIKCATWSRLCYVERLTVYDCSYLIQLSFSRSGGVIVTDTFLVTAMGSGYGAIVKVCGNNYGTLEYSVRIILNSAGDGYFEIYDDMGVVTSDTTQTIRCSLIPIATRDIATLTAWTDGTTIPDGYKMAKEILVTKTDFQSDVTDAINSRLEVNKSATRQSIIDTTSTSKYTCPCDGYVYINVKANSRLYCYIYDSAGVVIGMIGIGGGSEYAYNDTLFVKKGMLLCMEDNTDTTMGSCNFIGLDG